MAENLSEDELDWFDQDIDQKVAEIKLETVKEKSKVIPMKEEKIAKPETKKLKAKVAHKKFEKAIPQLSFTKLDKIAKSSPYELMMEVFLNYENFLETHQNQSPEILLKLLQIDGKILELPFHTHCSKLTKDLADSHYFWNNIIEFISSSQNTSKSTDIKVSLLLDYPQFWKDLNSVLYCVLIEQSTTSFPESLQKFLDALKTLESTSEIERLLKVQDEIKLNQTLKIYDMYPTLEDLKGSEEQMFSNKIVGEYKDVNEYLQIHLPLLKHEFLDSLKNGIEKYFSPSSQQTSKTTNSSNTYIHIYPKSKFVIKNRTVDGNHVKLVTIKFSENSNFSLKTRFMPGQLLCLTSNEKFEDLVLAVVTNRDEDLIRRGHVTVDIVKMQNIENLLDREFFMFENLTYFDPHFHVFNTIRKFNEFNFPFHQYFLKMKKTPELPDYISTTEKLTYTFDNFALDMAKPESWPKSDMEDNQLVAFKSALLQKLTLIQGPPGTGKTFVALKILQALLNNTNNVIVILTATNEALDNFILSASELYQKNDIIRLGCQSKNENVKSITHNAMEVKEKLTQSYHGLLKSQQKDSITKMQRSNTFEDIRNAQISINNFTKLMEENRQISTYNLIQNKRIVGMTTSYAARCNSIIKMMESPIVIVEEAAEILEPALVSVLSKNVSQLIMIGDHQQLRPQLNSYNLSASYKFDISLFERLIINQINVTQMNVQRRMSPEICDLLRATIYQNLKDAASVQKYPNVKGSAYNLAWIDHNYPENNEDSSSSKRNSFEAEYIVKLCDYLIRMGNDPSRITILTPYIAQLQDILEFTKKCPLKSVRMTLLDTYQGEENDIILISLVRSRPSTTIGFLTSKNRFSVLLSRAKFGFFIVGNSKHFQSSKGDWKKIIVKMTENKRLHSGFYAKCDQSMCPSCNGQTFVSQPDDFMKINCESQIVIVK